MRRSSLLTLIATLSVAAQTAVGPAARPLELRAPLEDKNFYLLSLIGRPGAARDAVKKDPVLMKIGADRFEAVENAGKSCANDLNCNVAAFQWSEQQINEAADALAGLYQSSPAVRSLIDGPLRASGMYVRYHDLAGAELMKRAWLDCIHGVNLAIEVYALGKAPRYAAIDSISLDPKTESFRRLIHHAVTVLVDDKATFDLAFSSSLRFALEAMLLNNRDEAGRFEPMEKSVNTAAFRRIKSIDWKRYLYSVILVPGSGNDRPGVALSPFGRLRDDLAAKRFREGKAPFILVSGGYVHPNQTEFAEAIEMKRDLMARFGIPEDAIIVDPHARHTTTNMRNANRLIYRYGIPFDRKALVTTDQSQSATIESAAFAKRSSDELGYVPYKLLGRTSPFDIEFLPVKESLQANPMEPLDP